MKMKNGVTQLQEKENTTKSSGMAVTNDNPYTFCSRVLCSESDALIKPKESIFYKE